MRLEGKVAVLTGAAGGIGLAIVEKFIEEGARLVAGDLNEEALQQLAELHLLHSYIVKAVPVGRYPVLGIKL